MTQSKAAKYKMQAAHPYRLTQNRLCVDLKQCIISYSVFEMETRTHIFSDKVF